MDLTNATIPATAGIPKGVQPRYPEAPGIRYIYLYDSRSGTTIRRIMGDVDAHLGAVERD